MSDVDLGKQLAQLRNAAGLTQQQLADATSYSRSRIAHIETGRTVPPERFWQTADDTTGAGGALHAAYLTHRTRSHPQTRGDTEADDVNRRALLTLMAGAATTPIATSLEHARRGVDAAMQSPSTARDASEWEEVAADHAVAVGFRDPMTVLPAITADFGDLSDRIAAAAGTVRTSMVAVAADMAALTAITLGTMRDHATAARWWRTANRAAADVGAADLMARVAGKQAVMALYSQPLRRVIDLAERAIERGKGRATTGVLSGVAARTQALARLGNDDEAHASLRELAELFERYDGDTTRNQWGQGEQRLRFVEAEVHGFGGRVADTVAARDAATVLYPPMSWAGPAQVEGSVATALIREGNVTGGVTHMMTSVSRLQPWQRADVFVMRSADDVVCSIGDPRRQVEARGEMRALLGSAT